MHLTWHDVRVFAEAHIMPAGLRILLGLVIFFVGRWVARRITRLAARVMETSGMDVSLRKFLADLAYAILLVAVVIVSLDTVGIRTTAVVAVIGAAGLAIGLALQGSLSNFAAGVMIIVLRPYKVGDTAVIAKYEGRVEAIKVFHTILVTADHREITIPNAQIIAQPIENMTALGMRRVDIAVTVEHGTNLHEVKEALGHILGADVRVAMSPAPSIDISKVSTESIELNVRPWTQCDNYAAVAVDTIERIQQLFAESKLKYSAQLKA
jgi:small conductance mechanosensitive channel